MSFKLVDNIDRKMPEFGGNVKFITIDLLELFFIVRFLYQLFLMYDIKGWFYFVFLSSLCLLV